MTTAADVLMRMRAELDETDRQIADAKERQVRAALAYGDPSGIADELAELEESRAACAAGITWWTRIEARGDQV